MLASLSSRLVLMVWLKYCTRLFKDEIREMGRNLKIPERLIGRYDSQFIFRHVECD